VYQNIRVTPASYSTLIFHQHSISLPLNVEDLSQSHEHRKNAAVVIYFPRTRSVSNFDAMRKELGKLLALGFCDTRHELASLRDYEQHTVGTLNEYQCFHSQEVL
jgi:hypothetical protein